VRGAALEPVLELVPLVAQQARRARHVALAPRERGVDHEFGDFFFEALEVASVADSARVDGALGISARSIRLSSLRMLPGNWRVEN